MTARKPWLPASAAAGLTDRSPPSVTAADQVESDPASNPSAKIRSAADGGVGVLVIVATAVGVRDGVEVGVFVRVTVGVEVDVREGVDVNVRVKVGEGGFVAVSVCVDVGKDVGVPVGTGVNV